MAKTGVKILVVDDEAILIHDGHTVWCVDVGQSALDKLAQQQFDLVITDFSTSGINGNQLIASIRQIIPRQPIVLATAFAQEIKVFGEMFAEPDALLIKPFTLKELRETIHKS